MNKVTERFLRYVAVDTESKEDGGQVPSSEGQWELARMLEKELKELGASNVRMTEHCHVYATIPATTDREVPALGFVSHMDTSPEISGANIKARIVKNYDGGDIVLNEEKNIVLSPNDFSSLKRNVGQDLIVTDGTTLLGGDNKAGIAEIMTMAAYLLAHPEVEHGAVHIAFTPDEEVGGGIGYFDIDGFGAKYAYTVDGGGLGELEYENFNAASGSVHVTGSSIHPGSAKGKMKNASLIAMEFHSMLPVFENPAYTEGYEGFFHLDTMEGEVEKATLKYIIRDHDRAKLEEKKNRFLAIAEYLNGKYGEGTVNAVCTDAYRNMKEKIEPEMHLIENAKKAMEELFVVPQVVPIRGGTDGATLSFMGLPCPNLCTGGYNFHGKYEYVSIQEMEKVAELLVKIIEIYAR